ncbi:MAG: NADH-quinone oxidoreductase subunit L [Desulfuromonas sp.]|nr:MAG: NADH-quinone oxidoreductase subunit L [Desulfuromonas sp.]
MNETLLFLIPLLPLVCGVLNGMFGMRAPRLFAETLALFGVATATIITLLFWSYADGEGSRAVLYTWATSGDLQVDIAILFDRLSAPMTLMVTGVSTLIHLYAVGYMAKEKDYARFFTLLNLFVAAMLLIVLADNLLLTFVGWEGVGFCSYGLIGYWYGKGENADAGRKAFLVTRVGDVFFGIAMLWLFALTGTLSISEINQQAAGFAPAVATGLTLLLLLGASGKSAQLPLMTWLADAMAGPTPVSALIHAATMVTAGVYLLCRLFPLVSLSPVGMAAIALVGVLTAFYAATCALAQREIKRVLAYSTMSQVGYMFIAVGAGSVAGAMFHLLTHAFFKALLFMAAGCVIHLCHEENDIFKMGGVARRASFVFSLFMAGAICLAGVPMTGGFYSKDAILLAVYAQPGLLFKSIWLLGSLNALLTAIYTFRLLYLVFGGEARGEAGHAPGGLMVWPLLPLAFLGLGGGILNLPVLVGGNEWLHHFLGPLAGSVPAVSHANEWMLWGVATVLVAAGWFIARHFYRNVNVPRENVVSRFLLAGWRVDELVERLILVPFRALGRFCWLGIDLTVIDGVLEGLANMSRQAGEKMRLAATGRLPHYVTAFAWGLLALLGWCLWRLVSL